MQGFRARLDQRIQLLRALAEQLHGQRVPFGLVLHVSEGVDQLPVHRFRVPELAVLVRHRDAEGRIRFGELLISLRRLLHGREVLRHRPGQRLGGYVHQFGYRRVSLQGVGGHAGLDGQRRKIVGIKRSLRRRIRDHLRARRDPRRDSRTDRRHSLNRGLCRRFDRIESRGHGLPEFRVLQLVELSLHARHGVLDLGDRRGLLSEFLLRLLRLLQGRFRGRDLALELPVFLGPLLDLPLGDHPVELILCLVDGVHPFRRGLGLLREKFLLLGEQFRIRRIELQELLHVLQFLGEAARFLVDVLQGV